MPCPFRIKYNGNYHCGKRIPLECSPDICPFGPETWLEIAKNDKSVEKVWVMPRYEMMSVDEAFEIAKANPKIYLVKSISLKSQR